MTEQILMGFPLAYETQAELAKRLHEAQEAREDTVIACRCPQTQFFLAVYLPGGKAAWFECCGPTTERQAQEIADGISERGKLCRVML